MIDNIDVREFRGIKGFDTTINLSDLTILLGRNNAGKSSILEAIYTLFGGNDRILNTKKTSRVRDLHDSNLVYRYSGEAEVHYQINNSRGITKYNENAIYRMQVDDVSFNGENTQRLHNNLDVEYDNPNATTMLFSPSYESYRSYLNHLQNERDKLEKQNYHRKVAEFVNNCIGDEYTEIYLKTLEARKSPSKGDPFWVDLNDMGAGVLKAIAIYLAVESTDPKVLAWDDMETSLHPSLLRHILEWLIEKETQIIASTHSIDVLSTILDLQPQDVSIVQMAKTKDDIIQHENLNLEELNLVMENAGLDPRYLSDNFDL